jgi:hypothetical protein
MTFAASVKLLRHAEPTLRFHSRGRYEEGPAGGVFVHEENGTTTDARTMFVNLTSQSPKDMPGLRVYGPPPIVMVSPVPSLSTHGETMFMAPVHTIPCTASYHIPYTIHTISYIHCTIHHT